MKIQLYMNLDAKFDQSLDEHPIDILEGADMTNDVLEVWDCRWYLEDFGRDRLCIR